MKKLDQITLVIPTYRRRPFLARLAHFYREYPIELIIVDGTEEDPWTEARHSGPNCHYFHLPGESIFRRVNLAMQKVKTPFCAWLGDDEFQLPSGLACSADILINNPSVVTAIGSCVGFNMTKHGVSGGHVYGYSPKTYSNQISRRIEDFFLHYSPTMAYALWRSDQLKEATRLATCMEWGSGNLGEWIQAFCGLCQGNHVIHGQVQWLRSDENPPQQAQLQRSVEICQWWHESRFENERHALIHQLEQFLQAKIPCNNKHFAAALIKMAFEFTLFGDRQNKSLQLLGLKPTKNYNRDYSVHLAKILKAAHPKPPSAGEIARLIQSISIPYKKVATL
jgi:glycosyltransferase domain-containing protein